MPFLQQYRHLPNKICIIILVIGMLSRTSNRLAYYLCNKHYIDPEDFEWCVFTIEKALLQLAFLSILLLLSIVTSSIIETLITVLVFFLMRRRLGGYHAARPSLCLFLSSIIILSCHTAIDVLLTIPSVVLRSITVLTMASGYLVRPSYPQKAMISQMDLQKNNEAKKRLIILLAGIQLFMAWIGDTVIAISILYGTLLAIISVILQLLMSKGGKNNEGS